MSIRGPVFSDISVAKFLSFAGLMRVGKPRPIYAYTLAYFAKEEKPGPLMHLRVWRTIALLIHASVFPVEHARNAV